MAALTLEEWQASCSLLQGRSAMSEIRPHRIPHALARAGEVSTKGRWHVSFRL